MTPELQLLLICGSFAPNPDAERAVRAILAEGIDWMQFARKAADHGIVSLVARTLLNAAPQLVPDEILRAISVAFEETRKKNAALFNELAGVIDALANDGVDVIPFKGPALAIQSFRDFGLRRGDMHLIVRESDIPSIITTLSGLGYQRQRSLTESQFKLMRDLEGYETLNRDGTTLRIHTRLTPVNFVVNIAQEEMRHRARKTMLEGRAMTMLSPEDGLLALAIHGSKDGWWRINKACDSSFFIAAHPTLDWIVTIERAKEQACRRPLLVATALARRYFNVAVPDSIVRAELADPTIERIVERVIRRWLVDAIVAAPNYNVLSRDRFWLHEGGVRRARYIVRTGFLQKARHDSRTPRRLRWADVPTKIVKHVWLQLRGPVSDRLPASNRFSYDRLAEDDLARFKRPTEVVSPGLKLHEEARANSVRTLESEPDNVEALYQLGVSLLYLGRDNDAISAFRKLLIKVPGHVGAQHGLANALLRTADVKLGNVDEAARLFRLVLAARPDDADAHFGLGRALEKLGRYREAAIEFQESIVLAPQFAAPLYALGRLFQFNGDARAAREVLQKAMPLAPGNVPILYDLTMTGKVKRGDPVLSTLESLLDNQASLPSEARSQLHFALSKAYDDVGEPERGFRHLLEGNRLRRPRVHYDEVKVLHRLECIRHTFGANLFLDSHAGGNPSELPIFVVGMPRSGSSLVEQIIASHPSVVGIGECDEFEKAMERQRQRTGASFTRGNFAAIASPSSLRELGTRYLASIRLLAPSARRIVDKQLFNFCYVGLIHLALPNARFIHCVRDPVDTCLSCFSQTFAVDFAYDLRELGRFYHAYKTLMSHWRTVVPAGVILEVEYESLARNFESMTRQIVAHCGLDWNEACLEFHQTLRPVKTASALQVRQPIYQSSIGRWRPHEDLLRPLMAALQGY